MAEDDRKDLSNPTGLVRIWLRLEDFGQPKQDELIELVGIPLDVVVKKNDFNTADTFEATVDFEKFPIDARVIKGATVEIYMADGGSYDPEFWNLQTPTFMIDHCVMMGVVDHCKTGIGEDGREATIKGRDYTAYFLDVQAGADPIKWVEDDGTTKLTFVRVIQDIIAKDQSGNRKAIQVRDPDLVDKIYPGNFLDRGTDSDVGDRKKKQAETIWKILQNIAIYNGHILFMDLDEIVIRRPSTMFLEDGMDESNWSRWTIGEDVKAFNPSRKMGRQQGINVRCLAWTDAGETLVSVRPKPEDAEEKTQIGISSPAGETPETQPTPQIQYRGYVFQDIDDQDHLDQVADQLFELVRHHELEGDFSTDEMVDSDGNEMWRKVYGDPVVFDISESMESLITLDQDSMIRELLVAGFGEAEARSMVLTIKSKGVPFYFHSIEHRFTSRGDTGGYSMKAEIRSRRQVEVVTERIERAESA